MAVKVLRNSVKTVVEVAGNELGLLKAAAARDGTNPMRELGAAADSVCEATKRACIAAGDCALHAYVPNHNGDATTRAAELLVVFVCDRTADTDFGCPEPENVRNTAGPLGGAIDEL